MKNFNELLIEFKACMEAREWARRMTIEEVVNTCHRGDWLLWLANKVNVDDRRLALAKGLCANTVRHFMKDKRTIKAVDAAIAYGKGDVGIEELNAASAASDAAYAAHASAYAAAAASDAAYVAANAADYTDAAAYAAASYAAYAAASYAAAAARKANQMQTANICREIIGQEIISKVNELLK